MPQVLIVSNRLPVTVKKVDGRLEFETSMGGVATGLSSYITNRKNKWIGWPGISSDELTEANKHDITKELAKRNCVPVFLSRKQLNDFYNGYSNSLLWPLFHNLRLGKIEQQDKWWRAYRAVNRIFADVTLSVAGSDSTIWVHDYQLMLLPEMLRDEQPQHHIGFFLHIPFPELKAFARVTEGARLIRGMLGADLIGFHTKQYVQNFLDNAQSLDLGVASEGQLIVLDRTIRVTDFPMGIDYEKFANARKLPAVKQAVKEYKKKYKGKRVIAAVDRLDISKGFIERLTAYQEFLRANPKMHGKVIFALVGAPSRGEIEAYQKLSKQVDKLVADINAQFGTSRWQPVDYNNKGIPFENVSALFAVANIAFIAPLKDGMNLVAKEFIASKRKNGILILSDTAGAAQELQDALLVSHQRPDSLVAALEEAMNMPRREIRRRFKRMQKHLSTHTVHHWAGSFLQTLQKPLPGTPRLLTRSLNATLQLQLVARYKSAARRLILLDYDGTLVPLAWNFKEAAPPASLLRLLQKISADPGTELVLISGRSKENLETWLGGLPVSLVAEHGAYIRKAGHKSWTPLSKDEAKWKKTIKPVLVKYALLTPNAAVEEKAHSLVWHYRQSPPYYAQKYAVVLKRVLKPILRDYGLEIFSGSKILEIKNPHVNKGAAISAWLAKDHDLVLALGDDYTDEDMFAMLPADAYSIKVGAGRTAAKYRLKGHHDVRSLLKSLLRS